ncbi:MAG: phosphoenolpyruvate--protein phosphotransferase [Proteobacteria bacterium]|nr:phosphoenolpyruvate--protein phosphotransferase [Pseudomonadota bacterium]
MTTTVRMHGISASPGIAIGPARVIDRQKIKVPKLRLSPDQVEGEIARYREAVEESKRQMVSAKIAVRDTGGRPANGHSLILEAHRLMLEDEMYIQGTVNLIEQELINAEWAHTQKTEEFKKILAEHENEYFRERSQDIGFVGSRILRNLLGHVTEIVDHNSASCIVIADKLSPVEASQLVGSPVLGFTTEAGTRTSHTAIMAQALGIPAVVGVEELLEGIRPHDIVIVDGNEGTVIIRPDEGLIEDYSGRAARHAELEKKLVSDHRDLPAVTTDGVGVELLANIEFPAEAAMALDYGAEGIGLYRTEFLYLNNPNPSEDEQYRIYRTVIETLAPKIVVFRTFDLGADKLRPDDVTNEVNPALGLRAIRLGLLDRKMFKVQLRAMLRASAHGPIKIMFPMISGVQELREVKAVLREAAGELGGDIPDQVEIGCMIELPSAVMVADQLAKEVDFFSIGTNDLIQYSLAIDRVNDHVAYLYTPFHPSILRSVKRVIDAANDEGISVAMCGSLAGDPLLIPLLMGLGLRTLSMAPTSLPTVKAMVRSINLEKAQVLTAKAMELATATDVEDLLRDHVEKRLGD